MFSNGKEVLTNERFPGTLIHLHQSIPPSLLHYSLPPSFPPSCITPSLHPSLYPSIYLHSTSPQIFTSYQKHLQCSFVQGLSVFYSFVRSHLLPGQLPGSIQVTWQLYPHFYFITTTWGNTQCFCIHLIAPPTVLQS